MKIGIAKCDCYISEPQEVGDTEGRNTRNHLIQFHMDHMEMPGHVIFQIGKPGQIDEPVGL